MNSHLPKSRRQCSIITKLRSVLMRRLHMKPIFFRWSHFFGSGKGFFGTVYLFDNSVWAVKSQQDWWAQCAEIWSLQLINLHNIFWHYFYIRINSRGGGSVQMLMKMLPPEKEVTLTGKRSPQSKSSSCINIVTSHYYYGCKWHFAVWVRWSSFVIVC